MMKTYELVVVWLIVVVGIDGVYPPPTDYNSQTMKNIFKNTNNNMMKTTKKCLDGLRGLTLAQRQRSIFIVAYSMTVSQHTSGETVMRTTKGAIEGGRLAWDSINIWKDRLHPFVYKAGYPWAYQLKLEKMMANVWTIVRNLDGTGDTLKGESLRKLWYKRDHESGKDGSNRYTFDARTSQEEKYYTNTEYLGDAYGLREFKTAVLKSSKKFSDRDVLELLLGIRRMIDRMNAHTRWNDLTLRVVNSALRVVNGALVASSALIGLAVSNVYGSMAVAGLCASLTTAITEGTRRGLMHILTADKRKKSQRRLYRIAILESMKSTLEEAYEASGRDADVCVREFLAVFFNMVYHGEDHVIRKKISACVDGKKSLSTRYLGFFTALKALESTKITKKMRAKEKALVHMAKTKKKTTTEQQKKKKPVVVDQKQVLQQTNEALLETESGCKEFRIRYQPRDGSTTKAGKCEKVVYRTVPPPSQSPVYLPPMIREEFLRPNMQHLDTMKQSKIVGSIDMTKKDANLKKCAQKMQALDYRGRYRAVFATAHQLINVRKIQSMKQTLNKLKRVVGKKRTLSNDDRRVYLNNILNKVWMTLIELLKAKSASDYDSVVTQLSYKKSKKSKYTIMYEHLKKVKYNDDDVEFISAVLMNVVKVERAKSALSLTAKIGKSTADILAASAIVGVTVGLANMLSEVVSQGWTRGFSEEAKGSAGHLVSTWVTDMVNVGLVFPKNDIQEQEAQYFKASVGDGIDKWDEDPLKTPSVAGALALSQIAYTPYKMFALREYVIPKYRRTTATTLLGILNNLLWSTDDGDVKVRRMLRVLYMMVDGTNDAREKAVKAAIMACSEPYSYTKRNSYRRFAMVANALASMDKLYLKPKTSHTIEKRSGEQGEKTKEHQQKFAIK